MERFADIIFSSSRKQREFWLGKSPLASPKQIETTYRALKPCMHGSDAHRPEVVAVPDLNRYCWIKGDLSFESLRQAVIEPEDRVLVAEKPLVGTSPSETLSNMTLEAAPWVTTPALPLNLGLITIIGARGSGKTALMEFLAAGSHALKENSSDSSFLQKAGDLLGNAQVKLTWGDGANETERLSSSDWYEYEGADPQVRYLSQQFVERLCSSAGLATELRQEMERVVFELTPRLSLDGREFRFAEGVQTKGNARKTTGSYYTPDSLVQVLLDSALDPVLQRVESEFDDPVQGLLGVTVIDPACGSGHFLLAAARRIARRVVRIRCGDIHSEQDRLRALRDVVRSCVHGVDRNPMAVELTKVALWIETVEPGKPLGFLDANIRCGDSLLGIFSVDALSKGIPDEAYKALTGDDKTVAKYLGKRNKDEIRGQGRLALSGLTESTSIAKLAVSVRAARALPEDSAADISIKTDRFKAVRHDPRLENIAHAADLYVAAFLTPKTEELARNGENGLIPTADDVSTAMRAGTVYGPRLGNATQLSREARAFHWPLELPDVLHAGGFDVVLGNPPWEKIKLQEREFFASREPAIAEARTSSVRKRMIAALGDAPIGSRESDLYLGLQRAKRIAEASSLFARVGNSAFARFPLTGRGDVNTYALFAELFLSLTKDKGRAGLIVPSGIATEDNTSTFFRELVKERCLLQIKSFENEESIFPAVHHAFRFCLLSMTTKGNGAIEPDFSFFLRRVEQIADGDRSFKLGIEGIRRINPNTLTAPVSGPREMRNW